MLEKVKKQPQALQEKIGVYHEKTLKLYDICSKLGICKQWKACDVLLDEVGTIEKMKKDSLPVQALLEYGANSNWKEPDGYPLLHNVCRSGNYVVAELLLQCGANVNSTDKSGETVLFDVVNVILVSCTHDLVGKDKLVG